MRPVAFLLVSVAVIVGGVAAMVPSTGHAQAEANPVFVTTIPHGYRNWEFVSVAHEEGNLHSIGVLLANDVAIRAFREGKLPFPDGSILAALHYAHTPSAENDKIFGQPQSFVAGTPTNIQFMVKDAKKYAATGGWGYGHFNASDKKPATEAALKTCAPCHEKTKATDDVFTHYAP